MPKPTTKPTPKKPTLIRPPLKRGESYAGAIIKPDGTGHHIILLPGDGEKLTHDQATAWAEKKGGTLPDRVEQAQLFKHLKAKFKPEAYWSCVPYAGNDAYAWGQGFSHGNQYDWLKGDELRARAVRRVII